MSVLADEPLAKQYCTITQNILMKTSLLLSLLRLLSQPVPFWPLLGQLGLELGWTGFGLGLGELGTQGLGTWA